MEKETEKKDTIEIPTGSAAGKAAETLKSEGIDAATVPDISNPAEWRGTPKQGGGA